jgi:hypothetical protein
MTLRTQRVPLVVLLAPVLLAPGPLAPQLRPAPALHEAYFLWDEGRYVESMEAYLEVLEGPEGATHRREAALLTGELHPVEEVDDDGRFLRVSQDGRWVAWSREGEGGWRTHVEPVEGGRRVTLPALRVVLSSASTAAWVDGTRLRLHDLAAGREIPLGREAEEALAPLQVVGLAFAPEGRILYLAAGREDEVGLYRLESPSSRLEPLDTGVPVAVDPRPAAGGRVLVFTVPDRSPLADPDEETVPTGGPAVGALDLISGRTLVLPWAIGPSLSRDGSFLAVLTPSGDGAPSRILGVPLRDGVPASEEELRPLVETYHPVGGPAVSPDGSRLAYTFMPHTDWEVFVVPTDGSAAPDPGVNADPEEGVLRVTREAQHDQFPVWVDGTRLVAMKGEFRHRRSYLYDLGTGEAYRLFHSNTLRTIAPEYEWLPTPDGRFVFVAAERDGNTIAPERAVHRVDLTREVGLEEVTARVRANLRAERALIEAGAAAFTPIWDQVSEVTSQVSPGRIHHYAQVLYRMGSKFVTRPGNALAVEYLRETLESWGYDVELQWFEARGARSANVVATLPGTENPELVYVISSHFDSVLRSPGADDNSSGTTALLEAARVLRGHPRKATIQFAFLTAEEAGLLGAREFVRRAIEERKRITGVLNNDMVGWGRSHRLDNTVRHSNPAIRDLQHAAAHFFSELITYDALYYRGTDAAVFFEAYGDIVGGIGSYPVLGNPNYHQPTDRVETVDHRLVAEVSRATVAAIMLMADSPSRLEGLRVVGTAGGLDRGEEGTVEVAWTAAPEAGITGYRIRVETPRPGGPPSVRDGGTVREARARVAGVRPGEVVAVRAVRGSGTEGWAWARVGITPARTPNGEP